MPATFHLVAPAGQPTFLDLPWSEPLAGWRSERLVQVARGISRHVVRFVDYDGRLYALKELPPRIAEREFRLLRTLGSASMPVVEVVGVVRDRGDGLDSVLITRHLDFSIPYRLLFAGHAVPELRSTLLRALAELLVRLHLAGFFWGDCSLSNTLFRRDAGALTAYLVDAETGERHPSLTPGQREHDLHIADQNVMGELLDVAAEVGEDVVPDPVEATEEIRRIYDALWSELTSDEVIAPTERFRVDDRLSRLNALGFDVAEIALEALDGGGLRLRLDPQLVDPGHHRRRLLTLVGLSAEENQARRMLNDLAGFRAALEQQAGRPLPESVAAYRWRAEIFEPAVAAVPRELWDKRPAAEIFHEILEHRWFLSERSGVDVGLVAAVRSYVDDVLRHAPDERRVLGPGGTSDGSPPQD